MLQLIISWSRAENFTREAQEDLIEYYNEFDEYEEMLDSVHVSWNVGLMLESNGIYDSLIRHSF